MKTEMQREYEQLCRIDENPGVQGLAQLGRNAINRVSRLESQLASADARTAELERNIERLDAQWREELRIYRETEGARIAELVDLLTECRDCVASDINHTLAQFHEPAAVDYLHALLMRVDAAMAARANGGEG